MLQSRYTAATSLNATVLSCDRTSAYGIANATRLRARNCRNAITLRRRLPQIPAGSRNLRSFIMPHKYLSPNPNLLLSSRRRTLNGALQARINISVRPAFRFLRLQPLPALDGPLITNPLFNIMLSNQRTLHFLSKAGCRTWAHLPPLWLSILRHCSVHYMLVSTIAMP